MLKKHLNPFVVTICFMAFFNCDSNVFYDSYKSYPNKWHKDSIAQFVFKAPDTLNPYNLFINIRNNTDYKFNNLFLISELNFPNGKIIIDTLEYKMAHPNGKLLGEGFTDIKENKLWYRGYKETFKFLEHGDYTVTLKHAMRKNGAVKGIPYLEGITEVGLKVESAQKQ